MPKVGGAGRNSNEAGSLQQSCTQDWHQAPCLTPFHFYGNFLIIYLSAFMLKPNRLLQAIVLSYALLRLSDLDVF